MEDLSNRKGDTILQRRGAIRAIAALLTTSSLSIGSAPPTEAAPEPYDIPVMVSTTGNFAFIGKQEVQSLGAVASVVNKTGGIRGRPLRFTFQDVQSSPVVTLQVANGLLAKHPPETVAVYLLAFNDMNEANWPNLKAMLENNPKLQLGNHA